jgi:predicted Zn-dependent peptidase
MVNEVFANTSRHLIQIPAIKQKPVNSVRHNEEAQDIKQANLAIGLRSQIGFASDDYPALMVYNGVLGAFPHSKLFVNVREKHSLAYFASSRLESTKRLQYILAGIDSSKYEEALSLIQAQLDDTRAGRFSDTDLSAAQKSIVNGLRSSQDNAGYVIDAHMIGLINNRERQPDELINAVKAVTADDVVRAARQVQLDTVFLLRSTSGKGGASSAK